MLPLGASVAKGRLRVAAPILATVTLHALGRRFERGERDVASVFRDLETLAASFPTPLMRKIAPTPSRATRSVTPEFLSMCRLSLPYELLPRRRLYL